MVEKLSKYISIGSVIILIAAIWHEYLFYSSFGINFFSYITFSEIITLFLEQIPLLLLIGIVVSVYLMFMIILFKKRIETITNIKSFSPLQQKKINSKNFRTSALISIICFLLFFGPLFMPPTNFSRKFIMSEGYFFLRVAISFIFLSWAVIPYLGSKFDIEKINLYAIIFIAIFYCSVYYSASHKLWSVKNSPKHYFNPTTIVLKDSTHIFTTDSLIMIGKTNNYVFIYRFVPLVELSHTEIIPMEQVKTIYVTKYGPFMRLP